ncbi:MAG: PQQ-binding-like beta-propeller repeat protein [Alphaproteobacteria bacterium]|nr:PQQ-binding-like beta-propeller repeat protein [Alphaproteobacteria bacterium]
MLNSRVLLGCGCLLSVLILGACTKKVLPVGTRISVLNTSTSIKPDVADGPSYIKIAEPSSGNWLQKEANAQHIMPNGSASSDLQKQWKTDFGTGSSKREALLAKPLVKDGTVYTLDAEGRLSAFELTDGKNLWQVELVDNNNVGNTALKGVGLAIENGKIYVTTGYGYVIATNIEDGSKIWERNLGMPLRIAPTVAANKVFVQSADNHFFALNAGSGDVIWDYDTAMENTTLMGGSPAAYSKAHDIVVTGFSNGEAQAFGATIGTPLWSTDLVENSYAYSSTFLHTIKASPIVEGNIVYFLGSADVFTAIDMRSGTPLWQKKIGGVATPLLSGNTLFVVTNDNELVAVNKENGNVLWATALDLGKKAAKITVYAPMLINNQLMVALSDGNVLVYSPQTGKQTGKIDIDEDLNAAPIVAGGYVIFTTSNAKIVAYK